MTLRLWLVVFLLPSVYCYAIAPSCNKVNEHDVNLKDWIRESYNDAMRMAAGAHFDLDQDQGLDDTRDHMFPGLAQLPHVLQYVKAVYGQASANRQDYQETTTPRNSPDIHVIFYCGDETFVNMGAQNTKNLGWYHDPWSNTAYKVGTDRPTPCGGSLAVTSQGVDLTTGKANRMGIILCTVIDRGSLASVERTLEHDSDLINDGADIDRLERVRTVLPENQREGEHLDEVYTFVGATDFARASLQNAIKNIDNYVYYAL
ncbi:MAG: hypothetical protein Q9180_007268, partial [Flavoplaca navasiana]